jgi:tetratricopeptide (TPR) repeat protein
MEDFDQATYGDQVPGMVYFTRANLKFDIAENAFSGTLLSVPVTISWGESLPAPAPEATDIPDYGTALNDYDRAIALMPGFAFAYFNRGNLKARTKDYTGALADYARATELAPGLGAAWFNKGLTLIYLHDTDAACEDLSRAGELGLEKAYQVIARFCRK